MTLYICRHRCDQPLASSHSSRHCIRRHIRLGENFNIPYQERVHFSMLDNVSNAVSYLVRQGVFTRPLAASYTTSSASIIVCYASPVNTGSVKWDVHFPISAAIILHTSKRIKKFESAIPSYPLVHCRARLSVLNLGVLIYIGNLFTVAFPKSQRQWVHHLRLLHADIHWCTCRMIRHTFRRVCASFQTFWLIHLGDDVKAGASKTDKRQVQLCCYRRLTIINNQCPEDIVVQSMQWTQYLFYPRHWRGSMTESQVETE